LRSLPVLKSTLLRALLEVCRLLPLPLLRALARGLAVALWPLGGRLRDTIEVNLAAAYPDVGPRYRRRLARASFSAALQMAAETGRVWLRRRAPVHDDVRGVVGGALWEQALASGRGIVLLSPHLGNWELLGQFVTQRAALTTLYEPPKLPALDALMQRGRSRDGAAIVPTDAAGIRRLLRILRGGGVIGVLPDQVPGPAAGGLNVSFMGVPCFTATLPVELLRRSGARALFCFARRAPGGFVVHFMAAEDALYDADNGVALRALNRGVESCLALAPAQYQWTYKRFRTRPRQRPDRYDRVTG